MTDTPRTLVVIVNYRTAALVVACLHSLQAEMAAYPDSRVVVVDNCSDDGSAQAIAAAIDVHGWSGWAHVLPSPVNGGFAYGNNLAVRQALRAEQPPDLIWLLNPDTVARPGALRALVDFMRAHPKAGIAGSGLDDEHGVAWPYAFRFPSIWSELDSGLRLGLVSRLLRKHIVARRMSDQVEIVDWLPGASMMVRREVFGSVGLMDDDYFLYFEETDFCLQARRAGWSCWYVPDSRVMHIAGQSTGVTSSKAVPRRLPAYWFASRRRYFVKNHGRLYACAADALWLAAYGAWRLRRWVQRKPDTDPPHMGRDFVRHSAWLNAALPVNVSAHGRHAGPASAGVTG